MPCCLLGVVAFFPRIALFLMWLTGYGGRAFDSIIWPLLGFFFAPFTTCAWAIAQNEKGGIEGWALILFVIAVVLDISHMGGGGEYSRRKRGIRR